VPNQDLAEQEKMPLIQQKIWKIFPPIPPGIDRALEDYPPVLRQLLFNRGLSSPEAAQRYLEAAGPAEGSDPFALLGMEAAVERIRVAISGREPIAVYGDYDVDGVTATALMVQALQEAGAQAQAYIPHRFEEGYGLNNQALEELHAQGIQLVITVDCGVRALAEAAHARNLGLDLVVVDHHHPGEALPTAAAIINPKQGGDTYPEKGLAGVGLAYKLACALAQSGIGPDPTSQLDLVALGTVADLAPLQGENRSLVRAGLRVLQRTRRTGLQSLMGAARLHPARVTAASIGFVLGPRLNAAGRLDSALAAYRLLVTEDHQEAGLLAQQLDDQNRERQRLTRAIQSEAEALALAGDPNTPLLFAADPGFNAGVVGLAASRLLEQHYRPAVVAQQGEQVTRASCRSISEFHITAALDQCADLLVKYGGHAAAAGFTVRNEHLPALKARLIEIAREQLSGLDLAPTLHADLELPLSELHPSLLVELAKLEPTGQQNPRPQFVSRNLRITQRRAVGKEGAHLKMTVSDGAISYDAIAFRQGHWLQQLPERVDLLYEFELNEYNGRTSLQLNVRDIKPSR
jgi:single-stranded-DNA-specific exonuclease